MSGSAKTKARQIWYVLKFEVKFFFDDDDDYDDNGYDEQENDDDDDDDDANTLHSSGMGIGSALCVTDEASRSISKAPIPLKNAPPLFF